MGAALRVFLTLSIRLGKMKESQLSFLGSQNIFQDILLINPRYEGFRKGKIYHDIPENLGSGSENLEIKCFLEH